MVVSECGCRCSARRARSLTVTRTGPRARGGPRARHRRRSGRRRAPAAAAGHSRGRSHSCRPRHDPRAPSAPHCNNWFGVNLDTIAM